MSVIRNLIQIKSKVLARKNLKEIFAYLLTKIERDKEELQLENILELISHELQKNDINSIICVINEKNNEAIVRHINFPGPFKDIFTTENIKAINFQKFSKYQEVIKKKESVFCQDRISQIAKIIPQSKGAIKIKGDLNSIISPLILRGELIGTLEILSPDLKREDLRVIDDFVEKLVVSITNSILFKEIKESERRYRKLFKNSSDGLIFFNIKKKKFTDSNLSMRNMSDYTSDELKQIHYLRFFAKGERKRIEEMVNLLQKNSNVNNQTIKFCSRIKTKNGRTKDVNVEIGALVEKEEVSFSFQDVTEKKRFERKLKDSEEKYRGLVANAKDGVFTLDLEGNLDFVNQATKDILEIEPRDDRKLNAFDYVHEEDRKMVKENFYNRVNGKDIPSNYDFRIKTSSGKVKVVNYSGAAIRKQGKIVGVQSIIRDVSKKHELQKKMVEMKRYYEKVVNSIRDEIVVIDRNYDVISVNKFFASNVDLPKSKIIGAKFDDVLNRYKNGVIKTCCSGETCKNKCNISKVFKNGRPLKSVEVGENKNGELVYNQVNVFPVKNEDEVYQVVMTIRDVSSEKRAEESNRRLTEFNQKILDSSPVSILVLEEDGNIILANNLARKIMGDSQVVGENLFETEDMMNNKEIIDGYKSLFLQGKSFFYDNFSYRIQKEDNIRYLNIIAVPLYDDDGKVYAAISMALDNTEKVLAQKKLLSLNKDLERKVQKRTDELERANIELNKVLELKSKFLTDASHELRTPLTIIQGNLDLAIQEISINKAEIPEVYTLIKKEIEQMTGILSDLTMLTNADDRSESLDYQKVVLDDVARDVVKALEVVAKNKKIKLFIKRADKITIVKGDETKLEKLLLNIVRNAIKYTEEGGRIEVRVRADNGSAIMEVADNGIGIPEQDLPYIFERFYRVDKARSREEGGTGLGLSICKWIAEAHGGSIKVKSKLGEGTTFTVLIPRKKTEK